MGRSVIQHTAYKKGARGRAKDHADYIAGIGKNAGKEDVIYVLDGNVPRWAKDASDFFSAADEFERGDYTVNRINKEGEEYNKEIKGRAYIEFEWSVPRGIKDPITWGGVWLRIRWERTLCIDSQSMMLPPRMAVGISICT